MTDVLRVSVLGLAVLLLFPGAAMAQEEVQVDGSGSGPVNIEVNTGGPKKDTGFRLDLTAGVKGGLGGSWALEVPENAPTRIDQQSKSYYSQFGLGGDVGLAVDVRALGIVGLETGFRFSFDNGDGYNELTQAGSDAILVRINQYQRTNSMRIPFLLKVGKPNGIVKPTFGLGIELVRQRQSTIRYDVEEINATEPDDVTTRREERNQIEPSNYPAGTLALGIEIDTGPIKIPIELRAQYNLKYAGGSFEERVRVEGSGNDATYYYDGAYMGHFGVTVGLMYDHTFWLGD
ncbi:MAG: hypothetical protein VYE40_13790 [Myxococcota bacterium]|nr:hypothetical protein [Myxococcota bacterium]MEC9442171.1 hypothetical protein [Myxococcota bacterium]